MPDLEALFFEEGGTILLQASVTNVDAAGAVVGSGTADVGLNEPVLSFDNYRYDDNGDDDGLQPDGTVVPTPAVANDGKLDHDDAGTPLDPSDSNTPDASEADDVEAEHLMITTVVSSPSRFPSSVQNGSLPVKSLSVGSPNPKPTTQDSTSSVAKPATVNSPNLTPN